MQARVRTGGKPCNVWGHSMLNNGALNEVHISAYLYIAHGMLHFTSCWYSYIIGYQVLHYRNKSIYDADASEVLKKDQTQLLTA